MAEISAKPYFHRLQFQTHTFAKFHFFITFAAKVRALLKKRHGFQVRLSFCIIMHYISHLSQAFQRDFIASVVATYHSLLAHFCSYSLMS